ncbi:TlpA family protein disulfide reductase [Mesonia aquimarina]|uniref:TlpA family protein disulfide reductase n=1 Tax=Mesonia aquimarina TaxID=1504967 RepID=UPI000EF57AA5|nr:hypothetical protein [Mesonia aquimarina]
MILKQVYNYKIFGLLFLLIFATACKNEEEKQQTFIGGQVVNPVEDFITIYQGDQLLDTIFLAEDGTFSYNFPEGSNGLFTFRHSPESQLFYLEEGDSLMLRVNTVEFDESLMYSAEGADKNNFLMEMYLLNEKNNDLIFSYYKIDPKDFAKKTDSIKKIRTERLENLESKNSFSNDFKNLADKIIQYEYYDLRERYSFLVNKYLRDYQNEFPEDFFDYRKNVDFNDQELQNNYTYQRFLDNYLKNRSIEYCIEKELERDCYSLNNLKNLERRLKIADSIFTLDRLKYRFISRFARKEIIFSENEAQITASLELINTFDLPKDRYRELQMLAEIQQSYFVGTSITDKKIVNSALEKITFQQVINKPSILFTWSMYSKDHHKVQHEKINELRNRYPDIDFIGVNIDQGETVLWKKTIDNFDYDQRFEYQIRDRDIETSYYRNYLSKLFFVDENGVLTQGQVEFNDANLEQQILEFLNQ